MHFSEAACYKGSMLIFHFGLIIFFFFLYMGAMRPKLQQIGYLPVLKMHLNRLVKSLL